MSSKKLLRFIWNIFFLRYVNGKINYSRSKNSGTKSPGQYFLHLTVRFRQSFPHTKNLLTMKKISIVILVCAFVACSKKDQTNSTIRKQGQPESCSFGITSFNLTKRSPIFEEPSSSRGGHGHGGTTGGG